MADKHIRPLLINWVTKKKPPQFASYSALLNYIRHYMMQAGDGVSREMSDEVHQEEIINNYNDETPLCGKSFCPKCALRQFWA